VLRCWYFPQQHFLDVRTLVFTILNDPQRRNVGVEYYKPKLYLLVTTMKEGYKADILTLPDLTEARYAVLHPGYGSSNLSLKLNNGVLTDVGQLVDTKIPEIITALGSLTTAAGV